MVDERDPDSQQKNTLEAKLLQAINYHSDSNKVTVEGSLSTSNSVDSDQEHKVVEHLQDFIRPLTELPKSYLAWNAVQLLRESISLAFTVMGPLLIIGANLGFLGHSGSAAQQASFGLATTIINVAFTSLNILNLEKLGIDLSAEFGKRNYLGLQKVFTQGVITFGSYFCGITVPLMLLSRPFLLAVGVAEENAVICSQMLQLLLLPMLIELISALLRTFCMAQGFETAFTTPGVVNSVVCIVASYFLVVYFGLGVVGFMIAKLAFELINLVISIQIYYKTVPESRGLCSWAHAKDGFGEFFKETFKFSLNCYTEVLGFELISIFVANFHDNEQLSAYMAIINFTVTFYTFGTSISIISRTRVNILIGKGLRKTARNYYVFTWVTAFLFGCFLGIFFVGLNKAWISSVYGGSNPQVQELLQKLLTVYMFIMGVEISVATGSMGAKTVGRIGSVLKVSMALLFINPSAGLVVLWFGGETLALYTTLMAACTTGNLCYFYFSLVEDWQTFGTSMVPSGERPAVELELITKPKHSLEASQECH